MTSPPPPPPKAGAFSPNPQSYDYERPAPPLPSQVPQRSDSIASNVTSPIATGQQYATGSAGYATGPPTLEAGWLPEVLKDKTKPDLEAVLQDGKLLSALLHAPSTAHPSLPASYEPIQAQLQANLALAQHVLTLEGQIRSLRETLTPSLLKVSALERQFRAKQEEMDHALSPWAPKAVHTRLGQGVQEQDTWCRAMEESFLEGEGEGKASDREVSDWLRKYREGRKMLELRREKRSRLEEGRVGGWR